MKVFYNSLTEALENLKQKGFAEDFNLQSDCLICNEKQLKLHPEQFEIIEAYRFEGESSMDDSSVVYAIQTEDGVKGVLVDAYGPYAESLTPEMARKIRSRKY